MYHYIYGTERRQKIECVETAHLDSMLASLLLIEELKDLIKQDHILIEWTSRSQSVSSIPIAQDGRK